MSESLEVKATYRHVSDDGLLIPPFTNDHFLLLSQTYVPSSFSCPR